MEKYSRIRVLELMHTLFGVYEKDGHLYYPNQKQQEIATLLLTPKSTLNSWLQPSGASSYQTLIERLERYQLFEQNREQLHSLTEVNESLQQQISDRNKILSTEQRKIKTLKGLAAILAFILIVSFLWSSYLQPQSQQLATPTIIRDTVFLEQEGFVIKDRNSFDQIQIYHAELMGYRLFFEAVKLRHQIQKGTIPLQDTIIDNLAKKQITDAIDVGREKLRGIGFVNEEGKNIEYILEDSYPLSSLFKGGNDSFENSLKDTKASLLDMGLSPDELLNDISKASNKVRRMQWDTIWVRGW
jgi:hypothetical protein